MNANPDFKNTLMEALGILKFDSYYVNTFINQYVIDYLCSII